jgi:hypothetical protein
MFEVRLKMTELARDHGGASARVYDPTRPDYSLLILKIECDNLFTAVV